MLNSAYKSYTNDIFHAATFGSCRIEADAGNNVGTSTHSRDSQPMTVYSCVANDNCNYDVHVVGCYESYNHGYSHRIRSTDVSVNVQGQSSKPLILVLLSYEPINWILSIPTDVLIDTVIVVSQAPLNNNIITVQTLSN